MPKFAEAYTIPAAIEIASPMPVQKFADRPVEAKLVPSLVIVGCRESLSLLSKIVFSTEFLHKNILLQHEQHIFSFWWTIERKRSVQFLFYLPAILYQISDSLIGFMGLQKLDADLHKHHCSLGILLNSLISNSREYIRT